MEQKEAKRKLRIAVAKDVIKQLDAKVYKPTRGIYCEVFFPKKNTLKAGQQLQKALPSVKKCEVCAIGSAFLSLVRLDDKFKMHLNDLVVDWYSPDLRDIRARLRKVFHEDQLFEIECCFEASAEDGDRQNDAEAFGLRFKKSDDRLRAIMSNILENKGEFVPPKAIVKKARK